MTRMADTALKPGCTPPYTWGDVLSLLRESYAQKRSLRKVADNFPGVSYGAIQRALAGHEPQDPHIREALGLPIYRNVVVVTQGEVPAGTQAISALRCACGRWFIPNTPNRRRCFVCSPFRDKKTR